MEPDSSVALEMADFIVRAPAPFHVPAEIARRLTAAAFSPASGAAQGESGRGYVVRDGTVIAWSSPGTVTEATPVRIVAAHTAPPPPPRARRPARAAGRGGGGGGRGGGGGARPPPF